MKDIRYLRPVALLCAVLVTLLLSGCTAQSTPLDERAVVRLIWLEKAGGEYRALTMVCDFSADGQQQKVIPLTAQGKTVEEALRQAAGQRGGEPFFAQNRLLLLGPQLAEEELPQLLAYFVENCGAYRDPALWLWYGGEDMIAALQDPAAFVQMAEKLTQEDKTGCTVRVLEAAGSDTAVLPVLEQIPDGTVDVLGVRAGGLALVQNGVLRFYGSEAVLNGYGLLRGRQKEQLLTVEHAGEQYTLLLEELQRDLFHRSGRLYLTVRGACVPSAEGEDTSDGLRRAAAQAVRQQCLDAWAVLTQNGQQEVFSLHWWARQLGAQESSATAPVLDVSLHLE